MAWRVMEARSTPAWTALARRGVLALLSRGVDAPDAIVVAASTPPTACIDVPIIHAVRAMIERALTNGGLTMTKTGALSRNDVRALFDATSWPDFDREAVLAANKVLNESDAFPISFTRMVAKQAGLIRAYKGRLVATRRGKELFEPERAPDLYRAVFGTVFWRTNLAYFDAMPAERWPQTHIGVVLWCLSVVGHDWASPEELLATCTMPNHDLLAAAPDIPGFAMVTRVLRPLTWFGLMEAKDLDAHLAPVWRQDRRYRKAALFDQVLSFAVAVGRPDGALQ